MIHGTFPIKETVNLVPPHLSDLHPLLFSSLESTTCFFSENDDFDISIYKLHPIVRRNSLLLNENFFSLSNSLNVSLNDTPFITLLPNLKEGAEENIYIKSQNLSDEGTLFDYNETASFPTPPKLYDPFALNRLIGEELLMHSGVIQKPNCSKVYKNGNNLTMNEIYDSFIENFDRYKKLESSFHFINKVIKTTQQLRLFCHQDKIKEPLQTETQNSELEKYENNVFNCFQINKIEDQNSNFFIQNSSNGTKNSKKDDNASSSYLQDHDATKMEVAALKIQSLYRSYKSRSNTEQNSTLSTTSISKNQIKEFTNRDKDELARIEKAAMKIQSTFREYKKRVNKPKPNNSECIVQHRLQPNNMTSSNDFELNEEERAAIIIQSVFRRLKYYQKLQQKTNIELNKNTNANQVTPLSNIDIELKKMNKAAIVIQSNFRGFHCRKNIKRKLSKDPEKTFNETGLLSNSINNLKEMEKAATVIQSAYRKFSSRKDSKLDSNKPDSSKECVISRFDDEKAAILIQSLFRGFQCRKGSKLKMKEPSLPPDHVPIYELSTPATAATNVPKEKESTDPPQISQELEKAAKVIQSAYKQYQRRKNLQTKFDKNVSESNISEMTKENMAATLVQSLFRGFRCRKAIKEQMNNRDQCQFKSNTNAEAFMSPETQHQVEKAATLIQSAYKGFQCRKKLREISLVSPSLCKFNGEKCPEKTSLASNLKSFEMEKAALIIQSAFRRFLCRQKSTAIKGRMPTCEVIAEEPHITIPSADLESSDMEKAAIVVQSLFRGFQCRKSLRKNAKNMKYFPFEHNNFNEGIQAVENSSLELGELDTAEAIIKPALVTSSCDQASRQMNYKQECASYYLKRDSSSEGLIKESQLTEAENAAKVIQSAFRKYRHCKGSKLKENKFDLFSTAFNSPDSVKAAMILQASFRGFQCRKALKESGNKGMRQSIHGTNTDAFVVPSVNQQEMDNIEKAANLIQSTYRKFQRRKKLKLKARIEEEKAAAKIQFLFRELLRRKKSLNEALKEESLIKDENKFLRQASLSHCVNSEEEKAAVLIQSNFRGFRCRKGLKQNLQTTWVDGEVEVKEDFLPNIDFHSNRFKEGQEVENEAALIIQSAYRKLRLLKEKNKIC